MVAQARATGSSRTATSTARNESRAGTAKDSVERVARKEWAHSEGVPSGMDGQEGNGEEEKGKYGKDGKGYDGWLGKNVALGGGRGFGPSTTRTRSQPSWELDREDDEPNQEIAAFAGPLTILRRLSDMTTVSQKILRSVRSGRWPRRRGSADRLRFADQNQFRAHQD